MQDLSDLSDLAVLCCDLAAGKHSIENLLAGPRSKTSLEENLPISIFGCLAKAPGIPGRQCWVVNQLPWGQKSKVLTAMLWARKVDSGLTLLWTVGNCWLRLNKLQPDKEGILLPKKMHFPKNAIHLNKGRAPPQRASISLRMTLAQGFLWWMLYPK